MDASKCDRSTSPQTQSHAEQTARTLAAVNEILLSALTVDDVIARLVGEVSKAAGADKCLVIRIDGDTFTVTDVRNVKRGLLGKPRGAEFYPGFKFAASKRKPVLISDAWNDPLTNKEFVVPYKLHAFQLLPLIPEDEVVAVLALAYNEPRAFDDEDRASAQRMADAMSIALKNAQLYEAEQAARREARQQLRFSQVLLDSAAVFAEWTDIETMLDHLADVLLRSTEHSRVTIGLWDEGRRELTTVVSKGDSPLPRQTWPVAELSAAGRRLIRTRERVLVDYRREKDPGLEWTVATNRLRYALAVAVTARGQLLGTITVDAPGEHRRFSDREVALIQSVADQAGAAIEGARLFAEVRESDERSRVLATELDTLFNALPYPVQLHAKDGTYQRVNPAVVDLFGFDPTAASREKVAGIVCARLPDGTPLTPANMPSSRALKGKTVTDVEYVVTDIHGKDHVLVVNAIPFVVDGEVRGAVLAQLDITRRKAAEESARRLNERLSDILNSMADGFVSVDHKWRYTLVNPRAEQLLQKSAAELLGHSMEDQLPDTDSWPYYRRVMTKRVPEKFEAWSDSLGKWFEVHAYPTADGISILFTDISDRRRAEAALRASRERADMLATMLQSSSQPFAAALGDGELLDFNKAYEELTGYSADELHNLSWRTDLTPREWQRIDTETMRAQLKSGGPVRYEKEYLRKDGTRVPVEVVRNVRLNDQGGIDYFYAFFTDISERKRAERLNHALEEINRTVHSTLEFQTIISRVSRSAAEALQCDSAEVILLERGDWVKRYGHGVDAREIGRRFTAEEAPAATRAAIERRSVLVTSDAASDQMAEILRREGISALLVAPMTMRDEVVGVLAFTYRTTLGSFSLADRDFAENLAASVSLGVENARLYERERTIADTLQEAVLAPPEPIESLEVAYLYRPASSAANVGGDFYDLFRADGDNVAIVIGDISGKGVTAARMTSLMRDGIRAYAYENPDPSWVLGRVNTLLYRTSPVDSFSTVFLGMLEPESGRLRCCGAAHPPPIILRSATRRRQVLDPRSTIVGVFDGIEFDVEETHLDVGDTLVLYTDGITEARRGGELFGQERLLKLLSKVRSQPFERLPEAILEGVLDYTAGALSDDTAILCVRRKAT